MDSMRDYSSDHGFIAQVESPVITEVLHADRPSRVQAQYSFTYCVPDEETG
jgi:hypothetical protein